MRTSQLEIWMHEILLCIFFVLDARVDRLSIAIVLIQIRSTLCIYCMLFGQQMLLKRSEELNTIAVGHSVLCRLRALKAMHWSIIDVKMPFCFWTFQFQFSFFHWLLDMFWGLKLWERSSCLLITMYKSWCVARFDSYVRSLCIIKSFSIAFLRIIGKCFVIQRRWLTLYLVLTRLIKWPATLIFLLLVMVLGGVLCSFINHYFWSIKGYKCTRSLYLRYLGTRVGFLF